MTTPQIGIIRHAHSTPITDDHSMQPGNKKLTQAQRVDKYDLYQQSVQGPESEIDFVDQTYHNLCGKHARLLREDFCGACLNCCEWVRRRRDNAAIGVDLDAEVLAWGKQHNIDALTPAARARITQIPADVLTVKAPLADVVLALNFSYFLFKTRTRLIQYFRRALAGLVADGIFFLDAYGGYDALRVLRERTRHRGFTYIWHQAAYNPISGEVLNHIDFSFPDGSTLPCAFTYDWRLWSLPEIRECLAEAGFRRNTVYWQGWDAEKGEALDEFTAAETADADAGWIAYIVAEK